MGLKLKAPPTQTPVTLEEAKDHLAILDEQDEVRVDRLLKAATDTAEVYLGRSLITQTWIWTLDGFPCQRLRVPRAPLQSVNNIKYVANDGTLTTWDSASYRVMTTGEPGGIEPAWGESWPSHRNVGDAIEVEFVAGYGDGETSVPESIRNAILLMVAEWDEYREGVSEKLLAKIPNSARNLLNGYRIGGLFAGAGTRQ